MNKKQTNQIKATNYNFSETLGTEAELLKRSTFERNNALATGFNVGDIVPIYLEEIMPNDTVEMSVNMALRMQTLATVPFDNLNLDIYWFWCPNRLLWDGWTKFCGETTNEWLDKTPIRTPLLKCQGFDAKTDGVGTVWDYFGLPLLQKKPTGSDPLQAEEKASAYVNRLPFTMYGKIWNDWFRDVNLQSAVLIDTSNADVTYDINNATKGGKPLKANKYHDYFSSALPSPQRGEDTSLIENISNLEVQSSSRTNLFADFPSDGATLPPTQWVGQNAKTLSKYPTEFNGKTMLISAYGNDVQNPLTTVIRYAEQGQTNTNTSINPNIANLKVPLSTTEKLEAKNINQYFVDAFKVSELRKSIAKQHIAEISARCGNRYNNFLMAYYGVQADSIETGRTELLGINHTTLNISAVVQTSESQNTPQGNISGISLSNIEDPHAFTKSFVEHGYIMAVAVARYNHTYSQGIEKKWTRFKLDDYYFPQYANMGDVPVYKSEIYARKLNSQIPGELDNGNDIHHEQNQIWGYQEYGAELRYAPNKVTGAMRPDVTGGMSPWTWADNYSTTPTLGSSWIKEDQANINRSLLIKPKPTVPQLFGNFYFENKHTRAMPVHSIPGIERI